MFGTHAILYGGTPEELVMFCLRNCVVVSSTFLINELSAILGAQVGAPYKWLNFLQKSLEAQCKIVDSEDAPARVRDPKDDPVIATAIQGDCDYLVTGDKDLLVLGVFGYLRIVTSEQFIALIK